jgi:glycosyltransferase involved in cell wall biosynthesis
MSNPDVPDVKVSVALWTYNHEQFIAQAIESVLMQQTDFEYELIIGEDCSTDGTRAIVVEYFRKYPERIRPLLHEHNVGGAANSIAVLNSCRGQYIALLDGDDYLTDPLKLQKQVEFLEVHPECSMCFHDVIVMSEDQQRESHRFCSPGQKQFSTLEDLLEKNFIPTCSVVYRSGLVNKLPPWYYELSLGDWPLHVLHAQTGPIGYLDQTMGVYRLHRGGLWTRLDYPTIIAHKLQFYGAIQGELERKYVPIIQGWAVHYLNELSSYFAAAIIEGGANKQTLHEIERIVQALETPERAISLPDFWQRQFCGDLFLEAAVRALERDMFPLARYCMRKAVWAQPQLLRTKWIRSVAVRSIFGLSYRQYSAARMMDAAQPSEGEET